MCKTEIRRAVPCDMPQIMQVYACARKFMAEHGNASQWANGYPERSLLDDDILNGNLYVVEQDGKIHGAFALISGPDETYTYIEDGEWLSDSEYATIHRVASDGQVHGIFRQVFDYCQARTGHLRIDTHRNNIIMQHVIEQCGFRRCGIIYVYDGTPRIAYELC